jgi:hypothetical protein
MASIVGNTKIRSETSIGLSWVCETLRYKAFSLNLSFGARGGNFVSQTYRYGESIWKHSAFWMCWSIRAICLWCTRNYLVDNNLVVVDDHFNIVGGPTAEYGGFPLVWWRPYPTGVFNPVCGVWWWWQHHWLYWKPWSPGTKVFPTITIPGLHEAATFDASFLNSVRFAYLCTPSDFVKKLDYKRKPSVYSRNIMLWTKAGWCWSWDSFPAESGRSGNSFKSIGVITSTLGYTSWFQTWLTQEPVKITIMK